MRACLKAFIFLFAPGERSVVVNSKSKPAVDVDVRRQVGFRWINFKKHNATKCLPIFLPA